MTHDSENFGLDDESQKLSALRFFDSRAYTFSRRMAFLIGGKKN